MKGKEREEQQERKKEKKKDSREKERKWKRKKNNKSKKAGKEKRGLPVFREGLSDYYRISVTDNRMQLWCSAFGKRSFPSALGLD
jgi:phage portal protein BeeE